ncbi:MAG: hypothetical protein K2X82_28020 [Gemmataceae bacterium]|nr:hypothetical protein [Gemmataceae bacterium]
MFQFVAVAALYTAVPPDAYLIDYSSLPPREEKIRHSFRMVARDGSMLESREVVISPGATPDGLVFSRCSDFRRAGWRHERFGESAVLVHGSADSPIRLVEFRGKGWTPTVTPIWADKKK